MGDPLGTPNDERGLPAAARRYADHLLAAAGLFRPGAVEQARGWLGPWGLARFLRDWPGWRPHRLALRLALPTADELRPLAERCRDATDATAVDDLIAAVTTLTPEVQAFLDTAADLGAAVERRLPNPDDFENTILVDADKASPDWPRPGGLIDWLAELLPEGPDPGPADPARLLPVLDVLAPAGPADREHVTARGYLADAVAAWADHAGVKVVPAGFSIRDGGPAPPADAPGVVAKVVFRRDVPAGRVARVKAFGLVKGDEVIRPAEVVVSAGPPPAGLTELEAAAGAIPGPAGEAVREAFRDLRPAGLGGYLELAAVELYTRFWDRAFPDWAASDPAAAAAFGAGLGVMLRDGFGLTPFDPVNFRDYPAGWVAVPPGTRMTTGRVTRVLRPGLAAGDVLRVPARAEAE